MQAQKIKTVVSPHKFLTKMGFQISERIARNLSLLILLAVLVQICCGKTHLHRFLVQSTSYTKLCSTTNILTVNGQFPGPTLQANRGDKLVIEVQNQAQYNITLHWHGVRQFRNPWSDGAEYINQCPIRPGQKFIYHIQLTTEEGTIWWHAHSGWARATLHGIIIVYPKQGSNYPFQTPHQEVPIIIGEWWKKNVMEIARNANDTGGEPRLSDAYTINGKPGNQYQCSEEETFTMEAEPGKTYLLRILSAIMDENVFFSIADHKLTLVGTDGFYTKPFETDYIMITPGQTMDVLIQTNQKLGGLYYMAVTAYSSAFGAGFDKTETTAFLQYGNSYRISSIPNLPQYNNTQAATEFWRRLRSLQTKDHPIDVPKSVDTHLLLAVSVNLINCTANSSCTGPFGRRFAASLNNVSFVYPTVDVLGAYYRDTPGVFRRDFPRNPPVKFDYTGKNLPENLLTPEFGTRALVLKYNASVEMVLQGTNVLASDNHPFHLHGYGFYVVGWGFGNFDPEKDRVGYNLVDPPQETTVGIPNNGWVAIRFVADNPGVWLLHCHLERHQSWGMSTIVIVEEGPTPQAKLLPPPKDLPTC